MHSAWIIGGLMASLTGCLSETVVTEYVYPPAAPLQPCPLDYGERTTQDVTNGLIAGIECERRGKAETAAWIEGHRHGTE